MQPTLSVSMHCDCQAAISIAKNKTLNGKNRHIHLRHKIVKQLLKHEIISIDYVKSKVNLVDMGNNKSLANPASTDKIVPSNGVVMVL